MNARSKMTHRALAQRNANTAVDGYNQAIPPDWQVLSTVPCNAWFPTERHVDTAEKITNVSRLMAMVPLGTDITEADRLSGITDRQGEELFAGPLTIQTVIRKVDYLLLELRRVA